jgi:hypothetical protein
MPEISGQELSARFPSAGFKDPGHSFKEIPGQVFFCLNLLLPGKNPVSVTNDIVEDPVPLPHEANGCPVPDCRFGKFPYPHRPGSD